MVTKFARGGIVNAPAPHAIDKIFIGDTPVSCFEGIDISFTPPRCMAFATRRQKLRDAPKAFMPLKGPMSVLYPGEKFIPRPRWIYPTETFGPLTFRARNQRDEFIETRLLRRGLRRIFHFQTV